MSDGWAANQDDKASQALRYLLLREKDFEGLLEVESALVDESSADPRAGPEHMATVRLRDERAATLFHLKRYDEALAEFTWVATMLARDPEVGPDSEEAVDARWQRGACLLALSRLSEALDVFTELDSKYRDDPRFGPSHSKISHAREVRATLLTERLNETAKLAERNLEEGRPDVAVEGLDRALEEATRHPRLGPEHAHLSVLRAKRAEALQAGGRDAEALAEFSSVCESVRGDVPPEQFMFGARRHRAELRSAMGNEDGALEDYTWLVEVLHKHPKFGPENVMTARARRARALTLRNLSRNREAAAELARAVDDFSRHDETKNTEQTLFLRLLLVDAHLRLDRYRKAFDEVQRVLLLRAENPAFTENVAGLAAILHDGLIKIIPIGIAIEISKAARAHEEGRIEHALEIWEDVIGLASLHPAYGESHPDTLIARGNRVVTLHALGKSDTATEEWETICNLKGAAVNEFPREISWEFSPQTQWRSEDSSHRLRDSLLRLQKRISSVTGVPSEPPRR